MSFKNRWMIVGKLTTTTPLHIGSGDVTYRSELRDSRTGESVDISAVLTTGDAGRPVIPGATLKGSLRAWARRAGISAANFESIFGSEDPEQEKSVGGKVEFYDAVASELQTFDRDVEPPYWDDRRWTGVMASVSIDRRTRTASAERLFYHEFVPEGIGFELEITGQNLDDSELEDLLFLLNGFSGEKVALGASDSDGWGGMAWEMTDLRRITADNIAEWVGPDKKRVGPVGYRALTSLAYSERESWASKARTRPQVGSSSTTVSLAVALDFQGHFLVNDPSRAGRTDQGKTSRAPLLDARGRLLLPSSSLRGALRSQAEKILRTIRGEEAACYPNGNGPRAACEAVYDVGELARLCPACKVFGAPGWRSPVAITDFTTGSPVQQPVGVSLERAGHLSGYLATQEFVALDRFTGGSAHGLEQFGQQPGDARILAGGKKFNATSVFRPQLRGEIRVNLGALERAGGDEWAIGILVLLFRDLIEGDIRVGFGGAKGYGQMRASVHATHLPSWDNVPVALRKLLRQEAWAISVVNQWERQEVRNAIQKCVSQLGEIIF